MVGGSSQQADYLTHADGLSSSIKQLFSTSPSSLTLEHVVVLGMMFRCIRLFEGIVVLLRARLLEESAFLYRSLFTDSLRLRELAADEANRNAMALGWIDASLKEAIGLFTTARQLGLDDDVDKQVQLLNESKVTIRERLKQLGLSRTRKFPSTRELAIKHNKLDAFWEYQLAHEMVHGSDSGWIFSRQRQSDGTLAFHSRTPDRGLASAHCASASVAIVEALDATLAILARPTAPDRIGELLRCIQDAADLDPRAADS